jgi:DNA-binding PucR family transcriptional regulator
MLVDGEWVIAIAALESGGELPARGGTLTAAVGESLAATPEWTATVGVGSPRTRLADVGGSYAEARRAIALGRAVHDLGPLVLWSSLGAYRTLSLLTDPGGEGASARGEAPPPIPESFGRLLESADAATLVPTLERYLEHAGEARAAAADLYIHKSSLYQRLKRIEDIAAVDLSSGDDRLELHLGLRLWRMSGAQEP